MTSATPPAHLGPLTAYPIGLGCMGLSQGYGPTDDATSIRAIHTALDGGTTLLDTAMSYGPGHNERLVGEAVAGRRAEVTLATKFGIVRGPKGVRLDAHPDRIAGYCEASLRRLGVDTIDLYYLHRVDPSVPLEATVAAMAELVAAGKVRYLGLSEVTPEQLARAAAVHPIAAVQFEWSMAWRAPERTIVPAAREHGAGLVAYSPLGRGLLTATVQTAADVAASGFRANDPRFTGAAFERNRERAAALADLAAALGATPAQLALRWLLGRGPDVAALPGSRDPRRIAENLAAARVDLDDENARALDALAEGWAGDRASFAAVDTAR